MLKTVSSITNAIGALNYKGTWNASTNTPTLASGVGTKGDYYQVSVAGTTSLDGLSNWGVGDVAAFNGTTWQRIEGGADLNGVNLSVSGTSTLGGDVTLQGGNIIVGTSGKGIDFSATPGTGTSELFSDYEEGTWSPVLDVEAGIAPTYTVTRATYTKIGRMVYVYGSVNITVVGSGLLRVSYPIAPVANMDNYGTCNAVVSGVYKNLMIAGYNTAYARFTADGSASYFVNASSLTPGPFTFRMAYET